MRGVLCVKATSIPTQSPSAKLQRRRRISDRQNGEQAEGIRLDAGTIEARASEAARAAHRGGDTESHAPKVDPAVDQHARAARERPEVLVAAVAFEVEVFVGEYGRHLESRLSKPSQNAVASNLPVA